jgi:flagellar hook-basal body complex protein FliE
MPIEAVSAFSTSGPEWQIGMDAASDPALANDGGTIIEGGAGGSDFGGMLTKQIQGLADLQTKAAEHSTALANGTATDPAETIMAVERAKLSMQLASTLRTKGVEAINEVFHTQV